jgi:hypothetical protein
MIDRRLALFCATLGFLACDPREPELRLLHNCFDTFTSSAASAFAMTPWEAVQRAAADTLTWLAFAEPQPRDWTAIDESPR